MRYSAYQLALGACVQAGDRPGVHPDALIEHGVSYLITELVRVALPDRLRGKEEPPIPSHVHRFLLC